MAKRDTYSQELNAGGMGGEGEIGLFGSHAVTGVITNAAKAPVIQFAQANTGNQSQIFDLANAPVKATFTSTASGMRIELPPETAIDQVFISGFNLYLVQADGSVVVILGGAINFPTLVLGPGVEIPSDQLQAALDNAAEGVPTAGPDAGGAPGSSGGDFAVDPGGIGDLVDLTPLLPPTALAFDVNVVGERGNEPDLTPSFGNPQPGFVEEDDLGVSSIRSSSKIGNDLDGSAPFALTFAGNLDVNFNGLPGTISFPAGLNGGTFQDAGGALVTSNNLPVFLSLANPQTLVGFTDGAGGTPGVFDPSFDYHIFTVNLDSSGSGSYQIEVFCNIDHNTPVHNAQDGDTDFDDSDGFLTPGGEEILAVVFPFIATNSNGSASSEFHIGWQDDIPIIEDDVYEESESDQSFSITPMGYEYLDLQVSSAGGPGYNSGGLIASGGLSILWGADHGNDNSGNTFGDRMVVLTGVDISGSSGPIATLQALVPITNGSMVLTIADVTIAITTETVNGQDNQSVIRGTAVQDGVSYDVFVVTTSDLFSGSYQFTLNHPLLNPYQYNQYFDEGSYEENILFTFNFNAKDSDGDTVSGQFNVNVDAYSESYLSASSNYSPIYDGQLASTTSALVSDVSDEKPESTAGADKFVLANLDTADLNFDYNFDELDEIDLTALFSADLSSGNPDINSLGQFVRIVENGADADFEVDADGGGAGDIFQKVATLQGLQATDMVRITFDDDGTATTDTLSVV